MFLNNLEQVIILKSYNMDRQLDVYNDMSNRKINYDEILKLQRPNKVEDMVPEIYFHMFNDKISNIIKIYLFFEVIFCFKIIWCWLFTNSEDFLRNQQTSLFRESYDTKCIYLSYGIIIFNLLAALVIKKTYVKTDIPVGYIYEKPKFIKQRVKYWKEDQKGNEYDVIYEYEDFLNHDIIKRDFFKENLVSYKLKLKFAFIPLLICFIPSVWTLYYYIKLGIQLASQNDNESFLELVINQLILNYSIDFSFLIFCFRMVESSSSFKNYVCWTITLLLFVLISLRLILKFL